MYEFVRGKNICTMSHYFRRHLLNPLSESRPRYNSCNERCHAISQFRNVNTPTPLKMLGIWPEARFRTSVVSLAEVVWSVSLGSSTKRPVRNNKIPPVILLGNNPWGCHLLIYILGEVNYRAIHILSCYTLPSNPRTCHRTCPLPIKY